MYCHATNLRAVSVDDDWLNNFIIGDSLCKMRAEEVAAVFWCNIQKKYLL